MTATNHAITGAVIAVTFSSPWLALPAALLSHFVLDAVPHWDYQLKLAAKRAVMAGDLLLAAIIILAVAFFAGTFNAPVWVIVACGALAVVPDAMWLPHILRGRPIPMGDDRPLYYARRFHRWIQWSETKRLGILTESVWLAAMVIILFQSK